MDPVTNLPAPTAAEHHDLSPAELVAEQVLDMLVAAGFVPFGEQAEDLPGATYGTQWEAVRVLHETVYLVRRTDRVADLCLADRSSGSVISRQTTTLDRHGLRVLETLLGMIR